MRPGYGAGWHENEPAFAECWNSETHLHKCEVEDELGNCLA